MNEQIKEIVKRRVQQLADEKNTDCNKINAKKELMEKRKAEIIKVRATGRITDIKMEYDDLKKVFYNVHFSYFIKQRKQYYIEEEMEKRIATFYKDVLVADEEEQMICDEDNYPLIPEDANEYSFERVSFSYNRLKAIQYAERWWNDYNPQFIKFAVDCTNYISQCLYAGGAPMHGHPNRSKGWWLKNNNWSYSWSTAHSLRWYLKSSKIGLRGKVVEHPTELKLGDVIFYDFQGNGRYDHSTIVTAKDSEGMPLVNAHTTNSRMRYWSYEDSSAYTKNIQYTFITIIDDHSN